ncbi:hypothetical protein [Mycobacteroides abscessus]|nr:hypothetical protein [Mycobacteroides abscessus]EHM19181.1 hypothetical protein MMAS_17380 [Mycobacteroides abscessus subsp. massiliense CCUG 48898 = JCM 15300]EIV68329.1 hypothetical protein MMCCUG48898_1675 [Mycobacteroides abscessus subsp. massiliense CCUG 48898 = JCM 15300]WJJ56457.1 hypothetical protein PROPHICCUG48898T2_69 [Mycobacterium phage CCUG48898T-2]BAP96628.1 hypothetical protein MMASJCM_1852 [Mycobacteroides abscessus subsp. massiliense CCUG 48898 = JCM 15300]
MLDGQPLGEYPELDSVRSDVPSFERGYIVRAADLPLCERITWN